MWYTTLPSDRSKIDPSRSCTVSVSVFTFEILLGLIVIDFGGKLHHLTLKLITRYAKEANRLTSSKCFSRQEYTSRASAPRPASELAYDYTLETECSMSRFPLASSRLACLCPAFYLLWFVLQYFRVPFYITGYPPRKTWLQSCG